MAFLLIGIALGAGALWLWHRAQIGNVEPRLRAEMGNEISGLKARLEEKEARITQVEHALLEAEAAARTGGEQTAHLSTLLSEERRQSEEKIGMLQDAHAKITESFKALSSDALRNNNEAFLALAKSTLEQYQQGAQGDLDKRQTSIAQLVIPIQEAIKNIQGKMETVEKDRIGSYAALTEQVNNLLLTESQLKLETGNLVRALGTPHVRGRWGEMQLQRVVEVAGMIEHCDFTTQTSVTTEEGRLRPDMIVRLPGGKNIVVDAKAPMAAYLQALEASDDAGRKAKLQDHVQHIRDHIEALGRKSYFAQFQPSPEFVILFIPGEVYFSAALQADPTLLEVGATDHRVILATPTTLIGLLRTVSFAWREEALATNAKDICELGAEVHKRVLTMSGHFADMGQRLGKTVESYNSAVGSMERQVLPAARKFETLRAAAPNATIPMLEPVEKITRTPGRWSTDKEAAPELSLLEDTNS